MDLSEKLKSFNDKHEDLDSLDINSRVLFVDSTNSYIRCFVSTPTMNDDGEHMGGVTGFLKSVGMIVRNFNPTRVVCVFDGAGGSQRRRKLFEDYKHKKRSMTKLNRTYDFNSLDDEKKAMRFQLKLLIEILEYLPVDIFAVENIEADDVIAYLSNHVIKQGGKSTIMSTDKDFIQLISDNCQVYNPVKKKMYTPTEIVDEYKVHPHNFLLYRIIDGDTSDNVAGVKGIALTSLVKNFPFLSEATKYTIDDLINNCTSKGTPQNAVCRKLKEAADNGLIDRNMQLMQLDDVHISGTIKIKIIDEFNEPPRRINKYGLTKILGHHKLFSAFGNYDQWVLTTWTPLSRYCKE